MVYEREIMRSQADYIVENIILKKSGGGQSSNYVGTEFFNDALEKGVIFQTTVDGYPTTNSSGSDKQYVLNENYSLELGSGILTLIGEEYNDIDNKFIVSYPQTKSGKPQLNKVVYKTLSKIDKGYEWFFKLYCNNISGNTLVLDIDEQNMILFVDIEFSALTNFLSSKNTSHSNKIEDRDYPYNRIVFGAPGTGKSHRLNIDKELFEGRYERVTFHPNYSYSKFVGTYKPVPITYKDKDLINDYEELKQLRENIQEKYFSIYEELLNEELIEGEFDTSVWGITRESENETWDSELKLLSEIKTNFDIAIKMIESSEADQIIINEENK